MTDSEKYLQPYGLFENETFEKFYPNKDYKSNNRIIRRHFPKSTLNRHRATVEIVNISFLHKNFLS